MTSIMSFHLQCAASSFQLARASQPLCHHHNHKLLRSSSSSSILLLHSHPPHRQTDTQSFVFPVVAAVTTTLASSHNVFMMLARFAPPPPPFPLTLNFDNADSLTTPPPAPAQHRQSQVLANAYRFLGPLLDVALLNGLLRRESEFHS